MLTVEIEPLDLYAVSECSILHVCNQFMRMKEQYESEGFEDLYVMVKDDVECWQSKGLVLVGSRLETDKEFEKRLKSEKAQRVHNKRIKEKNAEREQRELRRLIEKHGVPEDLNE